MKPVFGAVIAAAMVACSAGAAFAQSGSYFWQGPYVGANLGRPMGHGHRQPDATVRRRVRRAGWLQLAERPVRVRHRSRHASLRRRRRASRRGNSPTPGSARCGAAAASRSTTCCSTPPRALPTARCERRTSRRGLSESKVAFRMDGRRRRGGRRSVPTGVRGRNISTSISSTAAIRSPAPARDSKSSLLRLGVNYRF